MSAGFWENFRRKDGTSDLVDALDSRRRANVDSIKHRKARDFLLDCEDVQPLRNADAATIALVHALRLAYED